jgi:hypothetical protein
MQVFASLLGNRVAVTGSCCLTNNTLLILRFQLWQASEQIVQGPPEDN